MSNKHSFYTLDSSGGHFSVIWKLTRMMKAAGWTYKASSDGLSTTIAAGSNGAALPQATINVASTSGFPASGKITIAAGGTNTEVTYTGTTGTTFTGCTGGTGTMATGNLVTYKEVSGVATADLWGGNADPTLDSYPSLSSRTGPWIVLEGPSIYKIPINSASTGTFTRGEPITQATSSATGELLGYVYDATNGGWLVVAPRTGTFNGSDVITGSISGATISPSATPREFKQQVCFWKSTSATTTGCCYYVVADAASETSSLFSDLAINQVNCTGQVAPAGGGTGNTFPTLAIAIIGTGGSTTGTNWRTSGSSSSNVAHSMIAAVNATPGSGVSADGSFWCTWGVTGGSVLNLDAFGLFRLDDTEPGDISPYAWRYHTSSVFASWSRTAAAAPTNNIFSWNPWWGDSDAVSWTAYIARGTGGASDVPKPFSILLPFKINQLSKNHFYCNNTADFAKIHNHPATTKPYAAEPLGLGCDSTNFYMKKGHIRWIRCASFGASFNSLDSLQWFALQSNSSTTNPSIYIGPWDGTSVPAP
jgi:hypothetical protein